MTKQSEIDWGAPPALRRGWYIKSRDGAIVHARHWPPRFDLSATGAFPPARMSRLARAVRQDLWRKLKSLRGFSPVVEITRSDESLCIRAGGRLLNGQAPDGTEAFVAALLTTAPERARWSDWARAGGAA